MNKTIRRALLSIVVLIAGSASLLAALDVVQPAVSVTYVSTVTIAYPAATGGTGTVYYNIYTASADVDSCYKLLTTTLATSYTTSYICNKPTGSGIAVNSIQRTTGTFTINWYAADSPVPTTVYIRVAASTTVDGEGPSSGSPAPSALLSPQISGYIVQYAPYPQVMGSQLLVPNPSFTLSSNLGGITPTPNSGWNVSIAAVSQTGDHSPFVGNSLVYTAAAQIDPSMLVIVSSWTQVNGIFDLIVETGTTPNSPGTAYAVRVTNNKDTTENWLPAMTSSAGQETAFPWWQTQGSDDTLIFPSTWTHTQLLPNTTYYYDFFARNNNGVLSGYTRKAVQTLNISVPRLSDLVCTEGPPYKRVINTYEPSQAATSLFSWKVAYASHTITRFEIYWNATDESDASAAIDKNWNFIISSTTFAPQGIITNTSAFWVINIPDGSSDQYYYFKVRALDDQGRYSQPQSFTLVYSHDKTAPKILTSNITITNGTTKNGSAYNGNAYGVQAGETYILPFSEPMDTSTINGANITLTMIQNSVGMRTQTPVVPTLNYLPALQGADPALGRQNDSLQITATFLQNSIYELTVGTACTDLVGNPLSSSYQTEIHTSITDVDNEISILFDRSPTQHAGVTIPKKTLDYNSYVVYSPTPEALPVVSGIDAGITAANRKDSQLSPAWFFECDLYDAGDRRITGTLRSPLTISMSYTSAVHNGVDIVDGINTPVNELNIWTLDETRSYWMKLPSVVDTVHKVVRATVTHLSTFALMGALNLAVGDVKCFPVPWAPESGRPQLGNLTDGITFAGMPQKGDLYIYTIKGDLVRHIVVNNPLSFQVTWDGRNDDNATVASGVYLWEVKSSDGAKTGKLIVVR